MLALGCREHVNFTRIYEPPHAEVTLFVSLRVRASVCVCACVWGGGHSITFPTFPVYQSPPVLLGRQLAIVCTFPTSLGCQSPPVPLGRHLGIKQA